MNAGVNNRTVSFISQPNKDLNWIQREAVWSARDHPEGLRVTTAAEIFFRYSKWHQLNQEVGKTTKKNKLDKNPYFCYFDASRRLTTAFPIGAWIENKQYI